MGTDYGTTYLNFADSTEDSSYNATVNATTDLTNNKAKARASCSGLGWAKAQSMVGKRITVKSTNGTTSQNALVKMTGFKDGAALGSGEAKYEIRMVITDRTINAEVLNEVIDTDVINGSQTLKNYYDYIPASARSVMLFANHEYDFMLKLVNEVNCNSNMGAQISFMDDVPPNGGEGYARLNKVEIFF